MKLAFLTAMGLLVAAAAPGASTVSSWVPIFQGIDQATGTNDGSVSSPVSVNALRIDLHDPDVRLMTTPPVTTDFIPDSRETLLQTPREFLAEHRTQVAINSGFFFPTGYFWPSGTPSYMRGLVVSQGRMVSAQTSSNDTQSAMLFATNNQATFLYLNWPATNASGVYNAVSGLYPLLSNGVNVAYDYASVFDPEGLHQHQPRTAFGLSQDGRHLFLLTIDGRQPGFSDGAFDWETAEFLQLFGAWNGMTMDGGGSTCMVKADTCGNPMDINHNSFQLAVNEPGSQRPVGGNFGVYARALPQFVGNPSVVAEGTTATVLWETPEPATSQVEYGLTTDYGNISPLNSLPRTRHVVTLDGLVPQTEYYFRAVSTVGSEMHAAECRFVTSDSSIAATLLFDVTKSWSWTYTNLDGVDWISADYDDFNWDGAGPGLLYVESSTSVSPRNTPMENGGANYAPGTSVPTHYFRTHFDFSGSMADGSLIFSNYLDDAAVFYLNGTEIMRLALPSGPITYATAALNSGACGNSGEASCPQLFTIPATGLVQGSNLLAVEVHNRNPSVDLVFGMGLILSRPGSSAPKLNIVNSDNAVTIWWNGSGFTLQQTDRFLRGTNTWRDVAGPVVTSPYVIANPASTTFYQLRK